MDEKFYKDNYEHGYADRIRTSQIKLTSYYLELVDYGKVIAEALFFLCPSRMEGYGHYINQAHAPGGVIVTSDGAPMNELVKGDEMGVLVAAEHGTDFNQSLGAYHGALGLKNVEGTSAQITS